MLFSVEQAFVGREEIRAPLKTPAWEATVYPVKERNTSSTIITIGHIDECHYVSTTALQSSAPISMCNELTNDTQSSINKHFIMSVYNTG